MENLLYLAEPTKDYSILMMLIVAFVILIAFLYLVQNNILKKIKGPYRQISLLLAGLMALILFATILFTSWNLHTIQSVKLYDTYMESYHGKTFYAEIRKAGIFNDKQLSMINPQLVVRESNILVVEKRDKKVMLFSEENYNLIELVRKIKELMEN